MFRLFTIMAAAMMAAACPNYAAPGTACDSNDECPEGYWCDPSQRLCRAVEADASSRDRTVVVDSATDAGVLDNQYPDVLIPDANNPDANQPDTWLPDGVVPDVNAPDAGQSDSFVPDSAIADTFAPDTAVSDATVEDAWTCVPTGPEIEFLGVDNCADGQDNDCDGLTDDESWDCQDRDGDGIANAVDVINILDLDQTTGAETVCVPAHLVMDSPWNEQEAYRQGTPAGLPNWSGMDTLEDAPLDPLTSIPDALGLSEWCHDFTGEQEVNYIYRYVGKLGANGTDPVSQTSCSDWVRSSIDPFCSYYNDAYCRRISSNDGCQEILDIIGVHWAAGALTPM